MSTFKPGDVFHQLAIEELLGEGLHGEVYAVRHRHTRERFALKVTHVAARADPYAIRRALDAARGTYAIDHANVVKVYDLGCEDDGMVWMRMELLAGCTVATLMAWQGRLSPLFALSVAYEAAWGLAAAHEAQVIHRDVKPANLFVVDAGAGRTAIKVLDFSIAKVLAGSVETTLGRAVQGTPAYMSPEQLYGAPAHPCFDVYSLGMTLWEMLAGFHPFRAELRDITALLARQVRDMPPPLAQIAYLPMEVDVVVRRAIAKDPAHRYPTMSELARTLGYLRDWMTREEQMGRLRLYRFGGEPALPGNTGDRRLYVPPVSLPPPGHHTRQPGPRVVVGAAAIDRASVAGTLPLDGHGLVELLPPAAAGASQSNTDPSRKDTP